MRGWTALPAPSDGGADANRAGMVLQVVVTVVEGVPVQDRLCPSPIANQPTRLEVPVRRR